MHPLQNSPQYDETQYRRPAELELIWAAEEPWNDGTTLIEYERHRANGSIWRVVQRTRRFYCMAPAWPYSPAGSEMTSCECGERMTVAQAIEHMKTCDWVRAAEEHADWLIEQDKLARMG